MTMCVEVLHWRDPDSACEVRVWVDGNEWQPFNIEDVDPGAGWTEEDWDQATAAIKADIHLSDGFKAAVIEARESARDSSYIERDRGL